MRLGVIGLGRMGGAITRRLLKAGHAVVAHDREASRIDSAVESGAVGAASVDDLVTALEAPRAVWLMLPAGEPTQGIIDELATRLDRGDTIIDGGNGFWKDDLRRAEALEARGLQYLDVGTSGGVWGLERGYCLMIGGEATVVNQLDSLFASLSPGKESAPTTPGRAGRDSRVERGYLHAGPCGAGHFVKMVHNAIEYGMMQAYAEGFDLLRNAAGPEGDSGQQWELELADIAEVWRHGSVISSWLLDLTATALANDPGLDAYIGHVEDSGEGRWALQAAIDEGVPATVLSAALFSRFRSRQEHTFSEKVLAAMRHGFGGHLEPPETK